VSPITSILIKFNRLQGGYDYEKAFNSRATQPVAKAFGKKPTDLLEAGKALGGVPLKYGDCSIQIPAIEGITIVYTFFGLKTSFLRLQPYSFDQSANSYLPTEDLAVLTELTSSRLIRVKNHETT
jgi:hypothetical protein